MAATKPVTAKQIKAVILRYEPIDHQLVEILNSIANDDASPNQQIAGGAISDAVALLFPGAGV